MGDREDREDWENWVDLISMAEERNCDEDESHESGDPQANQGWPGPERAAVDEIKRVAEREDRQRQQIWPRRLKEDLECCAS